MSSEGQHEIPGTFITWMHRAIKDTEIGKFFEFNNDKNGQIWFECIVFSIFAVIFVSFIAVIFPRKYEKIPRGITGALEVIVDGLRSMVRMLIGERGDKFLPYLGSLFIFIFIMNLIGIIPLFRSPTMNLSITLGLGITTYFVVQFCGIKANGIGGYIKHLMGPVLALAPLMFVIEFFGELIKPFSLSVRLYGNIYGEDLVIENLIHMGGWIPLQFPMLIFAIFTSFLQAFIFTALTSIYINNLSSHDEEGHGEAHTEAH